ncbi:helix-turn-helix domain-containing protein [Streptomyces goshikiensis]|uniref:helix-turn-helix domain-containing protein n=1 Tax=Streptomyces goshikiensis TaxID=1942 RepID=UPI0016746ED0|nr:tetratricopeptide repeat protein [Streptomyces goshikiensis]GHD76282.1 hypothetical protein GCM10010336_53840 [Streptomyces goshikiensis]
MHEELTAAWQAGADEALAELRSMLSDALAHKRLSKTQLATRTGLGRTTVQLAFQEDAPPPSATTVATLARVLGLQEKELLELRRRATAAPFLVAEPAPEAVPGAEPGPGLPISEWGPHALEVHPAGPTSSRQGPDAVAACLPGYVHRSHDRVLAQAVRDAAQGQSRMVVLVGTSSTGKTRACWEAVQPLANDGWRLWHPFDPTRAEAALEDLKRVQPRTVVWLNEAQHYFGDSLAGERVAAAVHALLTHPGRAPVLVLGTLWPEYERRYAALPAPGQPDPHSRVRELLAGRTFSVPGSFDADALHAAAALAKEGDQLLADALTRAGDHGQVTQDLAGAPELLRRFEHSTPAAKAVLEAAMDARRLGVGLHLPQTFLVDAATDYLSDSDYAELGDDWVEAAFAELARPVHGKQAPLRRAAARPTRKPPGGPAPSAPPMSAGPVFRLSDYLEQHSRTTRIAVCPPASFWHAAHTHLTHPDDLSNLADAALTRHRLQWEHHLRNKGAETGRSDAVLRLAERRQEEGDFDAAEAIYQQLADTGYTKALTPLARLRENAGDFEAAEAIYHQLASTGEYHARFLLAESWREAGDLGPAEALYQQLADTGYTYALFPLAVLRENAGDLEAAEAIYRQAASTGHTPSLVQLARLREQAGDPNPTETLYKQLSDSGHTKALFVLAGMQEEAGDLDGAEGIYLQLAATGENYALVVLAGMRERTGNLDAAEFFYQQAAESGHAPSLVQLARLREAAGNPDAAETLYQQAIDAGYTYALFPLARLREEAGDPDAAETLYQQAASATSPATLIRLARTREKAGDSDAAEALYRRLVDIGHANAPLHPAMRVLGGMKVEDRWPYGLDPDGTPSQPWK